MPNFSVAAGQTVASDVRDMFSSMDGAVHDSARLMVDFLDAIRGADLAPVQSQRALRSMSEGLGRMLEGRASMIEAQKSLVLIKENSNLEPHSFGCWFGARTTEPEVAGQPLSLVA